jgi:hypothetical protein
VARRKRNKKLTLVEIFEKKTVSLTALAIASEANLFPQASNDDFNGVFPDNYAPFHYNVEFFDDSQMLAG